jgi:hypothetical protein
MAAMTGSNLATSFISLPLSFRFGAAEENSRETGVVFMSMNSHRDHREHIHFSVISVASSLHKFENRRRARQAQFPESAAALVPL